MTPTPVTAPIALVVVFEDRARVVRRATVELAAGTHRLVIAGVAPVLADKSLVARAPGAAVHDVRAVRAVAPWRDGHDDDRAGAAAIAAARAERDRAASTVAAAQIRAEVEAAAARATAAVLARAAGELAARAAEGVDAPTAPARLDALTAQLTRHHQAAAAAGEDAAVAAAAAERFAARLADLERGAVRETASVVIDLEVATAGAIALEVGYTVPGACWRPYHTATWRGDRLEVATDACVWQATGEDWRDVALACSTARPSLGASPPELVDDVLRVQAKGALVAAIRDQVIATTGLGGVTPAAQVPGLDDGGQARHLTAPGRATVTADGRPHRVRLTAWTTEVTVDRIAYPELSDAVIVRTRGQHAGAEPLLAGPVDLVRDGGYTGRTSLLYLAPGERFELGWGADPALRLHRSARQKRDSGMLSSWTEVRHRIAIRLSNLGGEARTVTVTERIPVSELADKVEVALRPVEAWRLEDDDGALRDRTPRSTARTVGDHGLVSWQVELPPRQRRAIAHEYVVKVHDSVGGL